MKIKRFFKFFGIGVAVLIAGVLVAGQIANFNVPIIEPPGTIYIVNGNEMHLYCIGPENDMQPTVVIVAGLGVQSPLYYNLQEELAKSIRTCTYDRAGNGWSESNGLPRHVKNMSNELNQLLSAAEIEGPIILAGHSLGGAVSLVYSDEHPEKVAGIAFIDSTHYNQYRYFGQEYNDEIYQKQKELLSTFWIDELVIKMGILTLLGGLVDNTAASEIDEDVQKMYLYFFTHKPPFDSIRCEINYLEESLEQTKHAHYNREELPIVSLSASEIDYSSMPYVNMTDNERKEIHMMFGKELAELSTNGEHAIINGTNHMNIIQDKETAKQILNLIQ